MACGSISEVGGCLELNSIESHCNDIRSYINIANKITVLNIRGCNQTRSLLEKRDYCGQTFPLLFIRQQQHHVTNVCV